MNYKIMNNTIFLNAEINQVEISNTSKSAAGASVPLGYTNKINKKVTSQRSGFWYT